MEIRELGLREARTHLGALANYAHIAGDIAYLTRNGERIAAVVPLSYIKESVLFPTTYTAAIGLVSSVVAGDLCDVSVIENDAEDNMTSTVAMEAVELDVRADDEDVAGKVYDLADAELSAQGWRRCGDWDDAAGDAAYAPVERA